MPCLNPDGTLTVVAQRVLAVIDESGNEEEIASRANLPLFRVRSLLRELIETGHVYERAGEYTLTNSNAEEKVDGEIPEAF